MQAVQQLVANFERAYPKRAQKGLWGGRQINHGNSISHSERKYVH